MSQRQQDCLLVCVKVPDNAKEVRRSGRRLCCKKSERGHSGADCSVKKVKKHLHSVHTEDVNQWLFGVLMNSHNNLLIDHADCLPAANLLHLRR